MNLGPFRWLAHKLLGREYVALVDYGEPFVIVRARPWALGWYYGTPPVYHALSQGGASWLPLTPGVAAFYRPQEQT
jgi:hypothetical protein